MQILNVNSSLGLKTGGGTAERTFQMSRFLAQLENVHCTVLTLDIELDKARIQALAPAKTAVLPCAWTRFYVPFGGWGMIQRLVAHADIIHMVGHWSVLNALVYLAARRLNKPYVVCPAGALPIFGRSAILKRLYNFLIGRSLIQNASAWIAVTQGELPQFESYNIPASKVTVIPNGVNAADFVAGSQDDFLKKENLPHAPFILFMGRLNPIKGPDLLLQAYMQARHLFPEFHLVFAGPDGGMLSSLKHMVQAAELSPYVHFIGYVEGSVKSSAYHSAALLAIPSRQEAMSIVAIEAGICGTPVLLTDQCGFSSICLIDPRLEVAASVDGLVKGLTDMLTHPELLRRIAPVWKNFVAQHYAWDAIAPQYLALYQSIRLPQGGRV